METVQWQVKKPEDGHWLNVPWHMVWGMEARGYEVRELVDRKDAEQEINSVRRQADDGD